MDKKIRNITRELLKHNFLKQIIIRCDFTGMTDVELDELVGKLKPIFKEHGFDNYRTEFSTELDFQFDDPELIEEIGLPVKDIRKQKVCVFTNNQNGVVFRLTTVFALVLVENTRYTDFNIYGSTFIEVLDKIRKEISFFRGLRLGIRKINQCILTDIKKLNQYFDEKFFKLFTFEGIISNSLYHVKDCFLIGNYNLNLVRMIVEGEYDSKKAYQIILDSDIYSLDGKEINDLLENIINMKNMNDILFSLYKESITTDFLAKLQEDNFFDDNLIGVESNA